MWLLCADSLICVTVKWCASTAFRLVGLCSVNKYNVFWLVRFVAFLSRVVRFGKANKVTSRNLSWTIHNCVVCQLSWGYWLILLSRFTFAIMNLGIKLNIANHIYKRVKCFLISGFHTLGSFFSRFPRTWQVVRSFSSFQIPVISQPEKVPKWPTSY